ANIGSIATYLTGWTSRKFKRFVASSEPRPAPASVSVSAAVSDSVSVSAAVSDSVSDSDSVSRAGSRKRLAQDPIGDLVLPRGPTIQMLELLPGLVLMLDESAPLI